jgi:hypothetical protein
MKSKYFWMCQAGVGLQFRFVFEGHLVQILASLLPVLTANFEVFSHFRWVAWNAVKLYTSAYYQILICSTFMITFPSCPALCNSFVSIWTVVQQNYKIKCLPLWPNTESRRWSLTQDVLLCCRSELHYSDKRACRSCGMITWGKSKELGQNLAPQLLGQRTSHTVSWDWTEVPPRKASEYRPVRLYKWIAIYGSCILLQCKHVCNANGLALVQRLH